MSVLVAVASKHGSTRAIADAIADELQEMGIAAEVWDVEEGPPVDLYDAVVLGSAVYMGRWIAEARRFAEANRAVLSAVPVWLFASGPIGEPPEPHGDVPDLDRIATQLGARGYRTFAGRLTPGELGFGERLVVKAVRAQSGDVRAWEEIRGWAREIGHHLTVGADAAHP